MKIAVIGSRNLQIKNLSDYIPTDCDEIVSGGAKGVDSSASEYANESGLRLTVFWPDYARFGRGAPLVRNKKIVEYADRIIAFWDGESRGTKSVIDYCRKIGRECKVIIIQ